MKRLLMALCLFAYVPLFAQQQEETQYKARFEQMGTMLPTPNQYRTASGAPGPQYWQQRADYKINVTLHENNNTVSGNETVTYHNQSPNPLEYLWLQLDQNIRKPGSDAEVTGNNRISRDTLPTKLFDQYIMHGQANDFPGGFKISSLKDAAGNDLKYKVQGTMMKIYLPQTLASGQDFTFTSSWSYNINDRMTDGGRSGYEYFPEDDNYVYTIAQFYPRMCVYDDVEGWQNKQFLGAGEFALTFGDFDVNITVPADHIIAATGTLENPKDVLTKEQQKRWEKVKKSTDKVFVVTEEEAKENEKTKSTDTKTWHFHADNVRDFAFASSRKFIWEAETVPLETTRPIAQTFYPKEGNPLWEKESLEAVANTLRLYSKRTFDYPYPQATAVHAASIGMEYPMICFDFGRPNPDGTYSKAKETGMVYVIVHEVGHNYFPMIVNSDERQWGWMDEGLNSYLEYQTMMTYYKDLPYNDNSPKSVTDYMRSGPNDQRPIMTNPDDVLHLGPNAYGKPAAGLNILRDIIMGPEVFDEAFKTYANRWKFKHPTPADFFRTMEDASGIDLDWYWKGWFYSTDHVDIDVANVTLYKLNTGDKEVEKNQMKAPTGDLGKADDSKDADTEKIHGPFYFTLSDTPDYFYGEFRNKMDEKKIKEYYAGKNLYQVTFKNEGGLVMPIVVKFNYADGTSEIEKVPAEVWRKNEKQVTKIFVKDKEVTSIQVDPDEYTADTNTANNVFPRKEEKSRVEKFKEEKGN